MVSEKRKVEIYEMKMNVVDCGISSRSSMSQMCGIYSFIPDDIVIMILVCLPADILYNVMRHVCRQWYNIIQSPAFISSHLQNSTTGLVFKQNLCYDTNRRYILKPMPDHGCGVEVKELMSFKCVANIHASCNGLVFVLGPQHRNIQCPCYVANLVTKEQLPLPLIPDKVDFGRWYFAYAATSKVYKVFYTGDKTLILTVGVDKGWRKVDISPLTDSARNLFCWPFSISSISLRGFLYWVQQKKEEVPFILCFDMETETFKQQIPLPPACHNNERYCHVLAMGSSICLSTCVDDYSFKFWLLKDPETGHGQWERLLDIHLTGQMRVKWLTPCGWLRIGELLVLKAPKGILVYNVNTREFHKPEQLNEVMRYCYAHVDSLVRIPCTTRRSRSKFYSKDNMRAEFEEPSFTG